MSTVSFTESDMAFGPFPADKCWRIEKSPLYKSLGEGIKIAEFLLLRKGPKGANFVWIVEAKSSSPQSNNLSDFSKYIAELRDKLINTFLLVIAARLRRHSASDSDLPKNFAQLDLRSIAFRFILVIKGHPREHLAPLRDALDASLRSLVKTWAIPCPAVLVFNEDLARKNHLVSGGSAA